MFLTKMIKNIFFLRNIGVFYLNYVISSSSSMDLQNCWHSNIGVHFLYIAWHSIWPMDGRSYSIFCTYSSRFSIVTLDTGWLFVCPKNLTSPSLHKKCRGTKKNATFAQKRQHYLCAWRKTYHISETSFRPWIVSSQRFLPWIVFAA